MRTSSLQTLSLTLGFLETLMASVTVFRAVHVTLSRHEGAGDEGCFAEGAGKAVRVAMPTQGAVLVYRHTYPYRFPAHHASRTE